MENKATITENEYGDKKRKRLRTRSEKPLKKKLSGKMECFRRSKCYNILFEKGILYFLLSFFIPAGIMTYAFAQSGVHPFGDRQMLVVDLWHQYYYPNQTTGRGYAGHYPSSC